MPNCAGVVLCGGASRRMGRDKALVEIDGRPLVERVAACLREIADPVFLASGRPPRFPELGYAEVADVVAGGGPLAGLVAALRHSPHPLLAVAAVDLPYASPEVFALLGELHAGEDAVVPVTSAGSQPLHALYSTSALPTLEAALEGGRPGLRAALNGLDVRAVEAREWAPRDPEGRFAFNLNHPADLADL